jgi:hypothetical protein
MFDRIGCGFVILNNFFSGENIDTYCLSTVYILLYVREEVVIIVM